jgi:hypothetical protein
VALLYIGGVRELLPGLEERQLALHFVVELSNSSAQPLHHLPADPGNGHLVWATQIGTMPSCWTSRNQKEVHFFQWGTDVTELKQYMPDDHRCIEKGVSRVQEAMANMRREIPFARRTVTRDSQDPDAFLVKLLEVLSSVPHRAPRPYPIPRRLLKAGALVR